MKRRLGRTGLDVTALGYGAMELRGPRIWSGRPVSDGDADRILNAVLDAGINFIDTAGCYGDSERHIGRAIGHRRHEFYLATKCGCRVVSAGRHDETPHRWTRNTLLDNIESSLHRLRTEHVDLWQLHNPPFRGARADELGSIMEEVRAAGKVRFLGVSSTLPAITAWLARGLFDTFQLPYSALERTHEDVLTGCARAGAGTIVRGGVARGAPDEAGRGTRRRWSRWDRAGLDELRAPGESRTAFLLRFTLSHPDVHTTIVGTLDPRHLAANARAAACGPLPPDVYAEARRRLDRAGERPGLHGWRPRVTALLRRLRLHD
jgi:aryl-alcohol dehydrogenase-like predicted oxidoreductase